jgi:hypothetical protein
VTQAQQFIIIIIIKVVVVIVARTHKKSVSGRQPADSAIPENI